YYDAATPIHGSGADKFANGVISEKQMKSPRLAAVLNMGAANLADMLWTSKGSATPSVNDGLPVFRVSGENPSFPVTFDLADFDARASESQKTALNNASSTYPVENFASGGKGIYLFTDYNGNLASSDVAFANSLLVYGGNANNDVWKDAQNNSVSLSSSTSYDNGLTVYTFSSQQPMPYFCFKKDDANKILNFSQINKTAPETEDGTCFAYWYNDKVPHYNVTIPEDAYAYVSKWLNDNPGMENSPATINLTSKIDFAGKKTENGNTTCIDAPNALGGRARGFSLGAYQIINGNGHTISGLCHIDNDNSSETWFIYVDKGANVKNVTFSNVFFKTGNDGQVGVFGMFGDAKLDGNDGNITVKDSKFIVEGSTGYAAAIAPKVANLAGISNVTVENVEVKAANAGAVVGYIEDYSSTRNEINISNIKVIGTNSISSYDPYFASYVGGIIGYARTRSGSDAKQVKYENISVSANITGLNVGGIVAFTQETPDDVAANANNPTASFTIQNVSVFADINSYD
ncbi:MAG: hypothetical protein IIU33_02355, partial [Bacteroidales bacterium]|nr:hypothetical protein [Bacteroidales bacterium]